MGGQHGAGKGDKYRKVDREAYSKNYEAIFGKKKGKKKLKKLKENKKKKTKGKIKSVEPKEDFETLDQSSTVIIDVK